MKPITLKMKAFGPYVEETVLNFERGLGDEKIFLIHGDTGAGKTTILDAICYALYGETSGKTREGKWMRSLNVADDIATEVEFTFSLGKKKFTAYRKITYHPKRTSNKTQTQAELICDGETVATKDRDIKDKINELIGFNSDQFRQVVMLPQGKFAEFLSATADERQEVLNVLFDSVPYKAVEDTLREKAKTADAEAAKLNARLETLNEQIQSADSKSLNEIAAQLSETQSKVNELKKVLDDAQAKLSNGKTLADKFKTLRELTTAVAKAEILLNESREKLTAAQTEHQTREGEESARKELERRVEELKKISATLEELGKRESVLETEQQNLRQANEALNICERRTQTYEERLNQRKAERARLAGADADFERAKHLLERAKKLEKILHEISRLEKILAMEREKLSVVEEKCKSAQIELNRLQIVHSAAHLATKLVDGEPCPVCGSLEHPKIIAEAIPTVEELKTAEETFKRCDREKSQQALTVERTETKLSEQKNLLSDYADVPDEPTAQKFHDEAQKKSAELAACQNNIDKGEQFIAQNKKALDDATDKKNSASNIVARLEGEISGLRQQIPEIYLTDREKLNEDLTSAQNELTMLENAWKLAEKNFTEAKQKYSASEATFKTEQKNLNALSAELEGKKFPNLVELEDTAKSSAKNYDAAIREEEQLKSTLDNLKKFSSERDEVSKKFDEQQKIADMWRRLSDVANATGKGGASLKISFQRYFLSTMFNDVVLEANNRLLKMSDGRYSFRMKDEGKNKAKAAGLNLEILDEYNGKTRPVETLSGGESFLASLSLALGLAAVVQNKVGGIKLDTIFIDEGFGSLDKEALDFAISTIREHSGGRLVGIISHVEELKNRMHVRLEVRKTKSGSTAKFIS